ncbi:hypothetical protein T265_07334 [Opisthorchis viverrini]|uniref:Uncharacterized protein n=1 Tax=Opisthorchis viverrini TaxID=6198 RepID=A0A074ZDD5_OPIVI|nr:hypothetical protein T265_07334 [Opisthorchis viverrini]KER25173.1 hypothetical protein T265_07334 [Opisthorchis viverrini]
MAIASAAAIVRYCNDPSRLASSLQTMRKLCLDIACAVSGRCTTELAVVLLVPKADQGHNTSGGVSCDEVQDAQDLRASRNSGLIACSDAMRTDSRYSPLPQPLSPVSGQSGLVESGQTCPTADSRRFNRHTTCEHLPPPDLCGFVEPVEEKNSIICRWERHN